MAMTIANVLLTDVEFGNGDEGPDYVLTYQIYWTGSFDAPTLVYNTDSRLPHHLEGLSGDPNVYVSSVRYRKADGDELLGSSGTITATVTCKQKLLTYDPNPLSRPPKIVTGGTDIMETVSVDQNGNAIVNSAGDFYTPLPQRPVQGCEISITRNEATNPIGNILAFSYTTNNAAWFSLALGQGMFGKIQSEKVVEIINGTQVTYWSVTYPIRARSAGWILKLIDNGYRVVDSDSKYQNVTDSVGHKPSAPVLLDGTGKELAVGATPVVYPSAGYKINRDANWGLLGLPNPFI